MGKAEDANIAALQSVASRVEWVTHPASTGALRIGLFAPPAVDSGVAILTRPKTLVHIPLWNDSALFFSSRVQIPTVGDATTTYRVAIGGTNVDHTPGIAHTAAEAIDGIRDAINAAGPPVTNIVVATSRDTDGDGIVDEVLLQQFTGISTVHTTFASITVGPGAITADEDATSLAFQAWGLMSGTKAPSAWVRPRGAVFSGIDRKGFLERLDTAGFDRLYLELTAQAAPSGGSTAVKIVASIGTGIV